jgi:hypothetical protein
MSIYVPPNFFSSIIISVTFLLRNNNWARYKFSIIQMKALSMYISMHISVVVYNLERGQLNAFPSSVASKA